MLQQQMKSVPVITMTQMTEFMQKDIILQRLGQTDNVQIKIDIVLG